MKTCNEEIKDKNLSTNLTGMQLLNRGCEREQQLVDMGFSYNREVSSYISNGTISKSIRMINLLAYDDEEWVEYIDSITPFKPNL